METVVLDGGHPELPKVGEYKTNCGRFCKPDLPVCTRVSRLELRCQASCE
jgi:hypothetical protein